MSSFWGGGDIYIYYFYREYIKYIYLYQTYQDWSLVYRNRSDTKIHLIQRYKEKTPFFFYTNSLIP